MNENVYGVIMAGGVGKRFWPISNRECPKQFCDIMETGKSFLQATFERALQICPINNIIIVTGENYAAITHQQLPDLPQENILKEPFGKNTAPCIAYAAYHIARRNPNATMVVVPSDHYIGNVELHMKDMMEGIAFVQGHGGLLTIGITPTRPETGFGYIQVNQKKESGLIASVKTFTEKPNEELAGIFLRSGDFLWNAGIFIWQVKDIIAQFKLHLEEISILFEKEYLTKSNPDNPDNIILIYSQCPSISIDFGIMEKADNVFVLRGEFPWSDIGTWHSYYKESKKDDNGNVCNASKALLKETRNCIIKVQSGKTVVVEGLDNFIVAENGDVLMICSRDKEDDVRHFDDMLRK